MTWRATSGRPCSAVKAKRASAKMAEIQREAASGGDLKSMLLTLANGLA